MALIDVKCTADICSVESEVYRAASDWPNTPPCEFCGGPTVQIHRPRALRSSPDPVVVYQKHDGSYVFPGDTTTLTTAHYDRLGYTRHELRGFADVRRFEKDANRREASEVARRVERQIEAREAGEKARRSDLHHAMRSMSPAGRAVAEAALRKSDARRGPRVYDPGLRVEVYSESRGSRDESRDSQGRRRRD